MYLSTDVGLQSSVNMHQTPRQRLRHVPRGLENGARRGSSTCHLGVDQRVFPRRDLFCLSYDATDKACKGGAGAGKAARCVSGVRRVPEGWVPLCMHAGLANGRWQVNVSGGGSWCLWRSTDSTRRAAEVELLLPFRARRRPFGPARGVELAGGGRRVLLRRLAPSLLRPPRPR